MKLPSAVQSEIIEDEEDENEEDGNEEDGNVEDDNVEDDNEEVYDDFTCEGNTLFQHRFEEEFDMFNPRYSQWLSQ